MLELIFKKKLLVFSAAIILFIFAFGFLGTMYFFTDPDKIFRTVPAWAPEDNQYCSDPANQKNDFDRCYMKIGKYDQPSADHLLGLDEKGRDVLTRLAWGVRHSLEIGIVASVIITILAIVFGAIGAYSGGFVDDLFQFVVNLFIVIPVIPILIYIAYLTGQNGVTFNIFLLIGFIFIITAIIYGVWVLFSLFTRHYFVYEDRYKEFFTRFGIFCFIFVIAIFFVFSSSNLLNVNVILQGHLLIAVIIAFTNWGWAARSIRSQVLSLKERNFINMARVSGMNRISISIFEILPNMLSYISLVFVISIGISIASEAGLSVLGIGVPPNFTTLGTLLFWARTLLQPTNWSIGLHVFLPPGIIITVLFVFLYVMQAEMDDIFNPRLRKA